MNITAIMGGSFNPIHKGHIAIAEAAKEQFNLSRILMIPTNNPSSYKDISDLASAKDRCNMVSLAIEDYPYMELSDIEIKRGGKTYAADTLEQLGRSYDYIYYIIGADSLYSLHRWYKADYVCSHCHFLVAARDGCGIDDLKCCADSLINQYNAKISYIYMDEVEVSSSHIREMIANRRPVEEYICPKVYDYIVKNNIYIP